MGCRGRQAAFWLATLGGALALGLADRIGSFAVGKDFDALLVDTEGAAAFDISQWDTMEDRFQKFINLGDDRNILGVWVAGRLVAGAGWPQ
jgi:guanine deaminase